MRNKNLSKIRGSLKAILTSPRRLGIFAIVFAILLSVVITPANTYAVNVNDMSPTEKAKSWLYFNALSACVDKAGVTGSTWSNTMSTSGVSSAKWFISGRVNPSIGFSLGGLGVSVDGFPQKDSSEKVECGGSNIKWIGDALRLWGYSNNLDAWCELTGNLKREDGTTCSGSASTAGWDSAKATQALRDNFQKIIRQKVYNGKDPVRDGAAAYAHAQAAFFGGCIREVPPTPYTGSETGNTVYKDVVVVDPTTGEDDKFTYSGAKAKSDSIWYSISPNQNNISATCASLVDQMASNANAYAAAIRARVNDGKTGDTGTVTTCTDGTECEKTGTSCAVEGVGWIICPITSFMADVSDAAFGVISSFLAVNTSLYDDADPRSGTYAAWSAFRNIANVAFAILFIFIIYSQLTGMGVSNYGIKKTLPRLIIAAILVNLSFFICQLAVDVTQILGGSLNDFLKNIPVGGSGGTVSTWQSVMGPVLAGAAVGATALAGAAILALAMSWPLLLAFLVAVVMTLIILVGRQAAIVILIVLSPLAFVAYLLPNTEKWFKRWYTMFGALLMVFPIIALLYGGGALASRIISNAGGNGGTDMPGFALQVTAIAVSAIPLIMTPSLLRSAMKGTGSIGGKLSGWAGKANGRMKSTANNSRLGEVRQGMKNKFALRRAERRAKSPIQQKIDNSRLGKAIGLDRGGARALSAIDSEENKEVEAVKAQIEHQSSSTDRIPAATQALKTAIIEGDVTKARAAQRVLLGQGNAGISALQKVYEGTDGKEGSAERELSQVALASMGKEERSNLMGYLRSEVNGAGLKGKNNALARFGYDGKVGPAEISKLTSPSSDIAADTFKKLNPVQLAGQSVDNLRAGIEGGHISPEDAREVLASQQAKGELDGEKRALFRELASRPDASGTTVGQGTATSGGTATGVGTTTASGSGPSPSPSPSPAPTPVSPTGQQAGAGPGAPGVATQPPATQGTGPAAQQAQQTIQQAAQGTAGTSPFVVNSEGTATAPTGRTIPSNNSGSLVIPHGNSGANTPPPTTAPTPPPTPDHPEDYHRRTP